MTPTEYKQFLRRHGLAQHEFAALLGNSRRTGQSWADEGPTSAAATMARLIDRRPELLEVVREIAAERGTGAR